MTQPLQFARPVIAVTGSSGKTTTKEMIASILSKRWKIFKTKGNMNLPSHTAKYARQIGASHRAVVLEYGMSRFGQIKRHCQWIRPNIGIITNVGSAHIGNFGGKVNGLVQAKSELIQYMNPLGTLYLNADDANSRLLHTRGFKGTIVKVGIGEKADYRATHIRYASNGMEFQVKLGKAPRTFYIPIYGTHNVYNALFAIAVAHRLGCSVSQIRAGLRSYRRPDRRLIVYRLGNGIQILDDTFSSNPHATKAAINVLCSIEKNRRIAVLGSMLEMGKYSTAGHKEVGRYLARKKIDYLFTVGKSARQIGIGAVESGMPSHKVKHFPSKEQLHPAIIKQIKPNTTILVKGSHKTKMIDTVIQLIRAAKKQMKKSKRGSQP